MKRTYTAAQLRYPKQFLAANERRRGLKRQRNRVVAEVVVAPQQQRQITRGFVAGAAGADAKYFDVASASYACNTTGSITHLNVITQGNSINQREGKSYRIRNIQIRGVLETDTTTTRTGTACYLVWDKQPNKALAAITDIFDTITSQSFTKRENTGRFVILKKWHRTLIGNITTPATGREAVDIDKYLKLPKDLVTMLTSGDTTGVIGDIISGALLWVTMGSVAAGTADANATVGFRIGFTDEK